REHLEAAKAQEARRQQPQRARAEYRRAPRSPDLQPALDLVCLCDALLHDARGLEQHTVVREAPGNAHEILGCVDVHLGEETVQPADAVFEVHGLGGEVGKTDLIVAAAARPAHDGYDGVTDGQLGDRAANPFDHSQAFVAGDQVVVPLWSHAIRSEVDVAIGAVETD